MKHNLEALSLFVEILENPHNTHTLEDLHENTMNVITCLETHIKEIHQKMEYMENTLIATVELQKCQEQDQLETNTRICENCEHLQDLEETVENHTDYINYLERVKEEVMVRIEESAKKLQDWDFLDDWHTEWQYRNKMVNMEEKSFTGKWR